MIDDWVFVANETLCLRLLCSEWFIAYDFACHSCSRECPALFVSLDTMYCHTDSCLRIECESMM